MRPEKGMQILLIIRHRLVQVIVHVHSVDEPRVDVVRVVVLRVHIKLVPRIEAFLFLNLFIQKLKYPSNIKVFSDPLW